MHTYRTVTIEVCALSTRSMYASLRWLFGYLSVFSSPPHVSPLRHRVPSTLRSTHYINSSMLLVALLVAVAWATQAAKAEDASTERCVVVEQAALWDSETASTPSSLSPALKGDRLRVAEMRGPWARVTAASLSPRFAWVAMSALAACPEAERKKGSFLGDEIAASRRGVKRLRKRLLRCEEDNEACFAKGQEKLVRAMGQLRRLCSADAACAAARKNAFNN